MRLKATSIRTQISEDGTVELVLSIDPLSRGAVKTVVEESRKLLKKDGSISCELQSIEKARTLSQNALLWRLLTIYAEALNGGRTGEITPEKLYYSMLERYGVASFVAVPEECVEELRQAFREIRVIDENIIERNGKKTKAKTVKCILGSSKYNTKQMKNLIDGIFDDLAALGVECGAEVNELYDTWKERNN